MGMIDRYRDEFERRGERPPTAILLIYFFLILGAMIVSIKGAFEAYGPDYWLAFLLTTSFLIIAMVILANGYCVMYYMMNRLNGVRSINPVFHNNEMLLSWVYTREEWDRYVSHIDRHQKTVSPFAWRYYNQWTKFYRRLCCNPEGGRIAVYTNGIMVNDSFTVHLRPNRLVFSQAVLMEIEQERIFRLNLLVYPFSPRHVDILVPGVFKEREKELASIVELLNQRMLCVKESEALVEQPSRLIEV